MKKIMFNDRYGLTQAVIEGRKTVTRRVMKNQPGYLEGYINYTKPGSDLVYIRADLDSVFYEDCPYAIGEIVAVAQSYDQIDPQIVHCRIDDLGDWGGDHPGQYNKMFVRADLMPHQIRITSVRPERLQDITDEDCLKEGIFEEPFPFGEGYCFDPIFPRCHKTNFNTPREAFASLMDKISGRGTWEQTPFVWRIEFKLVK